MVFLWCRVCVRTARLCMEMDDMRHDGTCCTLLPPTKGRLIRTTLVAVSVVAAAAVFVFFVFFFVFSSPLSCWPYLSSSRPFVIRIRGQMAGAPPPLGWMPSFFFCGKSLRVVAFSSLVDSRRTLCMQTLGACLGSDRVKRGRQTRQYSITIGLFFFSRSNVRYIIRTLVQQ